MQHTGYRGFSEARSIYIPELPQQLLGIQKASMAAETRGHPERLSSNKEAEMARSGKVTQPR